MELHPAADLERWAHAMMRQSISPTALPLDNQPEFEENTDG